MPAHNGTYGALLLYLFVYTDPVSGSDYGYDFDGWAIARRMSRLNSSIPSPAKSVRVLGTRCFPSDFEIPLLSHDAVLAQFAWEPCGDGRSVYHV